MALIHLEDQLIDAAPIEVADPSVSSPSTRYAEVLVGSIHSTVKGKELRENAANYITNQVVASITDMSNFGRINCCERWTPQLRCEAEAYRITA